MNEEVGFRRNLGLFMAVMIGIGAMMGPGIFALPADVAKMVGPLGILSYLAMGLLTVFTALNYSEVDRHAALPIGCWAVRSEKSSYSMCSMFSDAVTLARLMTPR